MMRSFAFAYLLAGACVQAQQYTISTFAGGAPPPTPMPAVKATIFPDRVAVDAAGIAYFSSINSIFKITSDGTLIRVAGNSRPGYLGDGGPATEAELDNPLGLAIDSSGNIFIADEFNGCIRKVTPAGTISTVAGGGFTFGDGGPAIKASLYDPVGIAVDGAGNLYIADTSRIRKVSASGIITTVAGNGTIGYLGDDGPALTAEMDASDVAVDGAGNIYLADQNNNRIRKVTSAGIISTIAGGSTYGDAGDGGPATQALLSLPQSLTFDHLGNLYIADSGNCVIRKISTNGTITRVAGNDPWRYGGYSGDGGPALSADFWPSGVAVDAAGNIYVADEGNHRVRKISAAGIATTVAGYGPFNYSGDGGPATSAQLFWPDSVALDNAGNLYVAEQGSNRIRRVSTGGIITTVAGSDVGSYFGDGGPASAALLNYPSGVAVDTGGNLYIADTFNHRVRKVSANGIITTVAGTGSQGSAGDGGPAVKAQLSNPSSVAVDGTGNIFIADSGNGRVRKVSGSGVITAFAGTGNPGYSGDGGPADQAALAGARVVTVDRLGNVYIADGGRARKVSADGTISTVAGNGKPGYAGDCGPATDAQFDGIWGLAVDDVGNLFISTRYAIRRVSPDAITTTIAGAKYRWGYFGDGGPATSAAMVYPEGLTVDHAGNIYVADFYSDAVRILQPTGLPSALTLQNEASGLPGPVAPGERVVISGCGIGPAQLTKYDPSAPMVGTQLAGTTVSFNGILAPIVSTSSTQVTAVVPYAVSGDSIQVTATYLGTLAAASAQFAAAAPGLFRSSQYGDQQALAINPDGSMNNSGKPARVGDVIVMFATGEGFTDPPGVDGQAAVAPLPHPVLPVSVSIGSQPAVLQYAGGTPGAVGVMQINVVIPDGTAGEPPVQLQVGDAVSQPGLFIWVR